MKILVDVKNVRLAVPRRKSFMPSNTFGQLACRMFQAKVVCAQGADAALIDEFAGGLSLAKTVCL